MAKSKNIKKSKKSEIGFFEMLKVYFRSNVYENKELKLSNLFLFFLVFAVLLGFIMVFKNMQKAFSVFSNTYSFFLGFLLFPLFLLGSYVLIYIFLNALENNHKNFFESFLVFGNIFMVFFTLGNLLDFLFQLMFNALVAYIASFLVFAYFIYFIVMFIINFKTYYNTNAYRVITSLLLYFILVSIFFMPYALSYMLNNLR